MIRITLEKDEWTGWNGQVVPASITVREFQDDHEGLSWFSEDSYYAEPYMRKATIERIDT